MVECLHSTLKIIAHWIFNVLAPWPVTMGKHKQWAHIAAWWLFSLVALRLPFLLLSWERTIPCTTSTCSAVHCSHIPGYASDQAMPVTSCLGALALNQTFLR